jgi:hypothetical protein
VVVAFPILQLFPQQQHASALRHDRDSPCRRVGQLGQGSATGRQIGGVELRITARQNHPAATCWQGLIGQWAPCHRVQAHSFEQFHRFWIAEMESRIAGDRHREGA